MTAAPEAGMVDPGTVRAFVRMVHDAAARALDGAIDPGMLQLDFLHPNGGDMQSVRFAIGAVDAMADSAISAAEDGLNVYIEGRTIDVRASAGRGRANATRGVFALVDDADADKGKAGDLKLSPTWSIESSPGNRHNWILLDRALTPEQAEPLGRSLRAWIGSDSATAKLTQPYRVAGTPNFPDARKRARGRVAVPTRILTTDGPLWSADRLAEIVPPAPERPTAHVPGGRSGATSGTVEDLAADTGEDRSGRFFDAIRAAVRAGMFPADVEDVFRAHPDGCASKYLRPYDRLAEEIARAWGKAAAKVEEEAEAAEAGVDPTYPNHAVPVGEARAAVRAALRDHLAAGAGCRAVKVSTGCGKTRIAAELIADEAERMRGDDERTPWLMGVPTHKLGSEVEQLFSDAGVLARVFRGRTADDPDAPDTGMKMCLDLEAVELALQLGRPVSTSCCKGKHPDTGTVTVCPLFYDCAYQRQIRDTPEVWIGSHELLFSAPGGLGKVAGVVIDEGFWQAGIKGGGKGITLDDLGSAPPVGRNKFEEMAAADISAWRSKLAAALRSQEGSGGVKRRTLVAAGIDVELCTNANQAEWRMKDRAKVWPGMDKVARRAAAKAADGVVRTRTFSAVWTTARELLQHEDADAVSGRLVLGEATAEDGSGKVRVIRTHGVKAVLERFADVPTFIMDATLPGLDVLRKFHPDVKIVADIEATTPHATVRQVLGAPTSAGKLMRSEVGRNREAVRRAVLLRYVEAGRCPTLVIAQKDIADWLRAGGLPAGLEVAHFNAIAGLDGFKGVRLLIVIGRTMPNVVEVESMSGAITGLEGVKTAQPEKGPRWYDRTPLGLRMADGTGHPVDGDRHPDPVAEAVRWQIAEAEVMQAVGRARAVNRTAADPVVIEVWNGLALPLTVDEVMPWEKVPQGYEADMVADGMALSSPSDMAAAWPRAWGTAAAARQWLNRSTSVQSPIENILYRALDACELSGAAPPRPAPFRYKHPGARQKWRFGWYLPDVVGDPFVWLESRLGLTLAGAEYLTDDEAASVGPEAGETADHPENERDAA